MNKKFIARLKELRGSMSQEQFCEIIHEKQTSYSSWERGVREPVISVLENISNRIGVSADWLLGRTDERTPSSTVAPAATVRPTPAARSPEPTLADLQAELKSLTKRVAALEFAPSSEARRPAIAAG